MEASTVSASRTMNYIVRQAAAPARARGASFIVHDSTCLITITTVILAIFCYRFAMLLRDWLVRNLMLHIHAAGGDKMLMKLCGLTGRS